MNIKGGARGDPLDLADHLKKEENEVVRIVRSQGVLAQDIEGALVEMDAMGACLRTKRTLFHMQINPEPGYDFAMTDAQWRVSEDALLKAYKAENQPFIVVEHEKRGKEDGILRRHRHIVAARADLEHKRAIRCDHNYRKHEEVSRMLEREFGHPRVQGAHAERFGIERPDRTPTHAQHQQAERGAVSAKEAKALGAEIWQSADSGKAIVAALEAKGWLLAKGDKPRADGGVYFMGIDPSGAAHELRRMVPVKAKELYGRMADLDPVTLPAVKTAATIQREREAARKTQERKKLGGRADAPRPSHMRTGGPENGREGPSDPRRNGAQENSSKRETTLTTMRGAWEKTTDAGQLTALLAVKNIRLARVTAQEARTNHRQREFAKRIGRRIGALIEGEIVAVDGRGRAYRFTERTTGAKREAIKERLAGIGAAGLRSVGCTQTVMKEASREAWIDEQKFKRAAERAQKEAERREKARLSTPQGKTAQAIRAAWNENLPRHPDAGRDAEQLAEALAARGMAMARATAEEAYQSERAAALAKEAGNRAPVLREGEIVFINGAGNVYRLDERTTGSERSAIDNRLAGIDAGDLLSVANTKEAMREASRAAWLDQQRIEREKARPASWIETKILDCDRQARISGAVIQQDQDGVAVSGMRALAEQIETKSVTIHGPQAFAVLLDQAGIAVVKVTAADEIALEALRRDAELAATAAREAGSTMPGGMMLADVKAGDLAAVDRAGNVYRLNPYKLDLDGGLEARLIDAANASSSTVPVSEQTSSRLMSVTEARAGFEIERQQLDEFWTQRRQEATAERVTRFEERAADAEVRSVVNQAERGVVRVGSEAGHVVEKGLSAARKFAEAIIKPIEGIIAALDGVLSTPSKPTELQAEVAPKVAAEKSEQAADQAAYDERAARLADLLSQISRDDAERRLRRELGTELDDDRGRVREP
jgi:hypothetical protein